MIIEAIRIRLFGKAANKDYGPVSPKLTVCYGPNESGKTTLKEFIRTTMFKTGEHSKYPITSKSDSGEIDCITGSGRKFTVRRNGGKIESSIGDMPSDISGVDPDIYRSVYAMGPEDLVDTRVVESGDIKRRFLTVPGGEDMPKIFEDVDNEMDVLINESRITYSKGIGKLLKDLEEIDKEIKIAKSKGPEYERLVKDGGALEKELSVLNDGQKETLRIKNQMDLHDKQSKSMQRHSELDAARKGMGDADRAPPEGVGKYAELKRTAEAALEDRDAKASDLKKLEERFNGVPIDAIEKNAERIRRLNENIGSRSSAAKGLEDAEKKISELDSKLRSASATEAPAEVPKTAQKPRWLLPAAFLILAAVSAIVAAVTTPYLFIATAVSAVVAAITAVLPAKQASRTPGPHAAEGYGTEELHALTKIKDGETENAVRMKATIDELDSELDSVAAETGIARISFETDVRLLNSLVPYVSVISAARTAYENAEKAFSAADTVLTGYLEPYGSAEELIRIVALKEQRDIIDANMKSIREAMGDMGIDPGSEPLQAPEDLTKEIEEKQRKLGEIDSRKKAILKDTDTERLYNKKSVLDAELESAIGKWGVLSMEKHLADAACDEIYEGMQPRVIQTADRYLDMMTGGAYRMDGDPRTKDVSVRSGTEVKSKDKWSSGLAGQVCLSLKLAVAKELSDEKLPMLLDDVLLVFDSKRKAGACRALAEAAKDMQIVLFTCDTETFELMKEAGADVIAMGL